MTPDVIYKVIISSDETGVFYIIFKIAKTNNILIGGEILMNERENKESPLFLFLPFTENYDKL